MYLSVGDTESLSEDRVVEKQLSDNVLVLEITGPDVSNVVLELVQSIDPQGSRTVGVLTKCDLVPTDEQKRVLRALLNKDYYLQQGWFAVANRPLPRLSNSNSAINTNALAGPASPRKRSASERLFFARYPWTAVPDSRLGMSSLREGVKDMTNAILLHDLESMQRVARLSHQRYASRDSSHDRTEKDGDGHSRLQHDHAVSFLNLEDDDDVFSPDGKAYFNEEGVDEKEVEEKSADIDDTASEDSFVLENLQEVGGERAPPAKRPTMLINAFTVGLTMMLAMTLLGLGCEQLAQEFTTDHNWTRLLLLITVMPQIFVCLFFCQTIINILLQLLGPVRQLKHNSKYFSAVPVRRLNIKNGPLPHVTVQCPVYMEGLDAVIKPTVASLQTAIRHYERYGGTANLFFNDDGMQILDEKAAAERKVFYRENNIGWVARPKHNPNGEGLKKFIRRGKFKKASNMNYAMGISLKVEDKLVAVDRSRGAPPVERVSSSCLGSARSARNVASGGGPSEPDLGLMSRPMSSGMVSGDIQENQGNPNPLATPFDSSNDSQVSVHASTSSSSGDVDIYPWTQGDEEAAYKRCLNEVLVEEKGRAWADGDIRIGDYILIIDSDTRVFESCMIDAVSELEECGEVAILQFTSGVMNVTTSFFEMGITFFTNLIYTAIRYAVANGDVAPFVGHNAFLRWSALQEISYQDGEIEPDCNSTTPYEKFWSESHVSEDFDIALRLQTEGYIVRLAAYGGGGFKEGVSLTVYDELDRWEKYAYGCSELLCHPVKEWPHKGIFTPLFLRFLFSRKMAVGSKVTILAYIGTYYAIGYAWFGTLCNYFLIGWLDGHLDHFYMDSWHVWVALVVVFSIAGNVALAVARYRDTGKSLLNELWICARWIPLLFIFLGGISMHVSQAILCHLFSINMSWGATAKEVSDTSFFIELPIIARRFKYVFAYCIAVTILLICGVYVFPYLWRITQLVAIFPLAVMIGCHFTLPVLLNPALMTFTW
ncbi:hypothetical protein Sste5346_010361 [Sporothrix stenoceras]|uniref:Glycosyltransferase 2-like domain-containing protein n=1 Tax=Sporothrix stenoceras TaxID=5173 RepID=A0ABR3YG40_9PEZI